MEHKDLGDLTQHGMNCEGRHADFWGDYCSCALKQRQMIATEREMHAAWRKRAEEAEDKLAHVFTYTSQPTDNVDAWRLGEAANAAVREAAGDLIDRGLSLLKALQEKGYGIIKQ